MESYGFHHWQNCLWKRINDAWAYLGSFQGTSPKGELQKCLNGGKLKGHATHPSATSLKIFSLTIWQYFSTDFKLLTKNLTWKPSVKPLINRLALSLPGYSNNQWSIFFQCHRRAGFWKKKTTYFLDELEAEDLLKHLN